jgi:hypothetical protein
VGGKLRGREGTLAGRQRTYERPPDVTAGIAGASARGDIVNLSIIGGNDEAGAHALAETLTQELLVDEPGFEATSAPSHRGVPASGTEPPEGGVTMVEPQRFSRADARRRWAELIRLVYEVDPLECPRCGGEMRVIALIHEPAVIDKILRHLRNKGRDGRAGPWSTGPPGPGATDEAP